MDWWTEKCCEWCHYTVPSVDQWYGDQKYLNEFPKLFDGVYICDDYGVGLGPWNDNRMELKSVSKSGVLIIDKHSFLEYQLVIYHFASVRFLNDHLIKVSSRMTSRRLHQAVFDVYIREIMEKRRYVKEKYSYDIPKARKVPARNLFMRIYQQYFMSIIRLRHFYNLYRVND